jgi:ABC-type multidrug transport system fused ATPase/permease subunit
MEKVGKRRGGEQRYAFERAERRALTYRTEDDAQNELGVLFARLGVGEAQAGRLDDDLRRLLMKYCMEVPGNIAWYEAARGRVEREFRAARALVIAIALITALVLAGMVVVNSQVVTAQVGALVVAVLFMLQVLAASVDKKAQIGAFWRASADLKEALYTFEHTWQGKVCGADGAVAADFEMALWQEVRNARRIAREERDAYFATFRSPTEILSVATMSIEGLRARGAEAAALRAEDERVARSSAQQYLAEAQRGLIEAKARLAAATARGEDLKASGTAEPETLAATSEIAAARSEVVRYSELVKMHAKADMMNAG